MADTLRIRIDVAADVDDDLRDELLELEIESVTRPAGPPPTGSKAGEAIAVGALLVAVAPSIVDGVMAVVTSWLSRQSADVTVEIDGQKIAGTFTRRQRAALVDAYLARVAPSEDQA